MCFHHSFTLAHFFFFLKIHLEKFMENAVIWIGFCQPCKSGELRRYAKLACLLGVVFAWFSELTGNTFIKSVQTYLRKRKMFTASRHKPCWCGLMLMIILSGGIYKYSLQLAYQAKQLTSQKEHQRACNSSLCSILFVVEQRSFCLTAHACA